VQLKSGWTKMGSPRISATKTTPAGELLRSRRLNERLTMKVLAANVGCSIPTLSQFETGHLIPSDDLVHRVADVLQMEGADRDQFIEAVDAERLVVTIEAEDDLGRRLASKFARRLKTLPPEKKKELLEFIKREFVRSALIAEQQTKFGRPFTEGDTRRLFDQWAPRKSSRQIQLIADRVRADSGHAPHHRLNMAHVLEFDAPKLFKYYDYQILPQSSSELGYFGEALTLSADKRGRELLKLIRLPRNVYESACEGQSFGSWMIAHELGHLACGHVSVPISERTTLPPHYLTAEWQADEFAASLLMPAQICVQLSPAEISRQYGVSLRNAEIRKSKLMRRAMAA
jgi:transcriptional regulator with XRE-family HTH domain